MGEKDEKDLEDGQHLGRLTDHGGDAAESDTPQTEGETTQVDPPTVPGATHDPNAQPPRP
jgi:hypothetical protein